MGLPASYVRFWSAHATRTHPCHLRIVKLLLSIGK